MGTTDDPGRTKRRHQARLGLLRQRAALASVIGFAAFLGLAAQHAVGSTKRRATVSTLPRSAAPSTYFDQQADGYAFDDGSSAAAVASPPPPPVAQTNVS